MGFKEILFLTFCLLIIKSTLGANETCTETQCKLLLDGQDISAQFRSKSSEHGVRMVYFHLSIGNESYNPLQSYDRFLPNKWTWARDVAEPMLSFSYQYQVLSLGLLRNQVRNMDIMLSDEPRGCLANLTSSSKDIVVARTLLEKVTDTPSSPLHSEEVLCVSVVKRDIDLVTAWFNGNIQYHCCKKEKSGGNATVVQCDLPVKYNEWFMTFYHLLTFGIVVLFFFWPAVLIKPKQDPYEISNHNKVIPVHDFSPISLSTLWNRFLTRIPKQGKTEFYGKVELLILVYYFRVLFFAYIFLILNYEFFLDYFMEVEAKNAIPENVMFSYAFDIRSSKLYCVIAVTIFFIILPINFFFFIACKSKEEIRVDVSNKIVENLYCLRKRGPRLFYVVFLKAYETRPHWYQEYFPISNKIVEYLKSKESTENCKMFFPILFSLVSATFLVCWLTFIVFFVGVALILILSFSLGGFLLVLAFDTLHWSPFATLIKVINNLLKENLSKASFCFWMPVFMVWMVYFSLAVTVCCGFYIRMFGFVVVGLIINAQKTIPYATFIYIFVSNIFTCYNTFRKRFKEIKKMIYKHYKTIPLPNKNTPKTIPQELFWYICKKDDVLPIEQETFTMLANIFIISCILFLALAIIVFFGEVFNSSPLITASLSAGALLLTGKLTGTIASRLIESEKFEGWDKIKKSEKIKREVLKWTYVYEESEILKTTEV